MPTRVITNNSNDVDRIIDNVQTIAAATTLTAADSGKTLILSAAAGAAITLPAPASGLNFKFIVGAAFATTAWTIVTASSANIIEGTVTVASAPVNGSNEDTITFAHAAESVGDWCELTSNGTSYFIRGCAFLTGGITLTAT